MAEDIKNNRDVVTRFFDTTRDEGYRAALEQLSDDATWWTVMGTNDKDHMRAVAVALDEQLEAPIQLLPGVMTAEDDRVAVEARSLAKRKNGKLYENTYHFLFKVRGGVIVEVREHCDTAHARDVWSDQLG